MAAQATKEKAETARAVMKTFVETTLAQLQSANQLDGVPAVTSDVELGTPSKVVCDRARENRVDLIVMGTKGEHNVLERIFGSTTTAVMEHAPCHLWIVPEEARFEQIDIIAYASDLLEADPYHIWEVGKMLEPFSPIIHCVHVNVNGSVEGAIDFASLGAFFEHHAPSIQINFHPLSGKSVRLALEEFIENHDVDLLAMYAPHHNWFQRVFMKSHTKRMAYEARVPLLIIKK
jgi:nucleotide-binding universal stress UspA family protein